MLNRKEWEVISPLLIRDNEGIKEIRKEKGISLESALDGYQSEAAQKYLEMTEYKEENWQAIDHHRLSAHGQECPDCGHLFRSPEASFCANCGYEPKAEQVSLGNRDKAEKPTDEEVRDLVGSDVPIDTPIEERSSLPSAQEEADQGFVMVFVDRLHDCWDIFLKTKLGKVVGILIILNSIGGVIEDVSNLAKFTYDASHNIFQKIEVALQTDPPTSYENINDYIVALPPGEKPPQDTPPIYMASGTGIAPDIRPYLS